MKCIKPDLNQVVVPRLRPGATFSAGFTLLELLAALSIFALISAMAYGGLQSVMSQQKETGVRSQYASTTSWA